MKTDVLIVIPAYNEEVTILKVVKPLLERYEVLVIDDCSTDQTLSRLNNTSAKVISNKINEGYENSIVKGIRYGLQSGYKYIVTTDADGQIYTNDVHRIVYKHKKNDSVNIFIGARLVKQRWSEYLYSYIGKKLYGVSDPLSALKSYNVSKVKDKFDPCYKTVGSGFCIKLAKENRSNVMEFDINIEKRNGVSRFGSGVKANIIILEAIFRSLL